MGPGYRARSKVDAYVPGSFFGLSGDVKIACRRAAPECGGVTACESLDPAFLKGERRELNPEDNRILAAATLRTREMQDKTEVGRTLAYFSSSQSHSTISLFTQIPSLRPELALQGHSPGWDMM